MKHSFNQDYIHEGKIYKSINGIIDIPVRIEKLNPLEDIVKELGNKAEVLDDKAELIKMAVELGCGAESSLKRNSIETLKKKIEEA